ncbi:MAG TPA: threonine/serine exporter family protein [Erysipelotrichaceae bacterium]|nr:threonine/serine exporter family protein [Erysipelotrichaceae bacterium]
MEKVEYILDFCKELGKQMIVCGANIERVDLSIERICHAYGLHDVTCANLTTRISLSAKDDKQYYAHRQTDVPSQSFNLERLKKLTHLSYYVRDHTPDVTTLRDLLSEIKSNDFPWWIILIGYLIAMMALGRIFNAGIRELLVIELNTLMLFGINKLTSKIQLSKIVANFISMFLCSVIAMLLYAAHLIGNFYVVAITNAFFLIPGIQMINCARNLLSGNEMNGIIEFLKVIFEVCSIVAGVAAAYFLLEGLVGYPRFEDSIVVSEINFVNATELVVLSLLVSAGFSVVFNIQIKEIVFAAIGGTIVRIFYILFQLAWPNYRFLYTMLAAFCAALYSEILGVSRKEPSTLFLYPSIIPLIPGDLLYYTSLGLIWGNIDLVGRFGPDLGLSLIGISIGFVLCSTVVHYGRKIKFFKKLKADNHE